MPSIFETFKRVLTGRPPFDPADMGKDDDRDEMGDPIITPTRPAPGTSTTPAKPGQKFRPQVYITEAECRENGQRMNCIMNIKNDSPVQVELDKIKILRIVQELDTFLRPGEERQFVIRLGNRPQNTSDNKCEVYFKDPSGDYFSAMHTMEFRKLPDSTYEIYRFRLIQPIKDI